MKEPIDAISQIAWLPVYNASGETIPAFAAMRISGLQSGGEFTVAKPNANDAVSNILFNGPCEIPAAHYGIGTADVPAGVRYDTADGTPSNGDEWGVASGDWKLRNARAGYIIQGVINSSVGIATAVRNLAAAASSVSFTLAGRTGSSTISSGDTLTIERTTVAADTATPDDASATLPGDVNLFAQTLGAGKKRVEKLSVDGTATALIGSPGSLPAGGLSLTNDAETGAAKLLLRYGGTVSLVDSTEVCSWRFVAGIDDLLIQQIDVSTGNPDGGAIAFVYTGDGADYAQSSSNVMISSPGEVWAYDRFSVGSSSGGLWSNRYQGATGTGGGGDTVKGGIITSLGGGPNLDMGTW